MVFNSTCSVMVYAAIIYEHNASMTIVFTVMV